MILPYAIRYALVALIAIAAVSDFRARRIPNGLSGGGILVGIAANFAGGGLAGLKQSLLGFAVGFGVYFALYALHAMGAGDVKLMGAVGALVGPGNWWQIFLVAAIVGGVVGLCAIMLRRRLRRTAANILFAMGEMMHMRAPFLGSEEMDVRSAKAMRLPHALPIAFASLLWVVRQSL